METVLTVNDSSSTGFVKHFGDLGKLVLTQIAYDCYYENGHTIYAEAAKGKVVANEGGKIDVLYATAAAVAAVEDGGTIENAYCISTSENEALETGYNNFSNGKNGNVTFQYVDEQGNLLTEEKIESKAVVAKGKVLGNPTGSFVQIGENPFAGLFTDVFFLDLNKTTELNFAEDIAGKYPYPSYFDIIYEIVEWSADSVTKNVELVDCSNFLDVSISSEEIEDDWGEDTVLDFTVSITPNAGGLGSIKLRVTNYNDYSGEFEFKVMVTDNKFSINGNDAIFTSIEDAVAASNNGDVIKLENDIGGDYLSIQSGEWQTIATYGAEERYDSVEGKYISHINKLINVKSLILDLNGHSILTNGINILNTNLTIIDSVGDGKVCSPISFNFSGNEIAYHHVTSGSNYGRVIKYDVPTTLTLVGGFIYNVSMGDYVNVVVDGAIIMNTGELYYQYAVGSENGRENTSLVILSGTIFGANSVDVKTLGNENTIIIKGGTFKNQPDSSCIAEGYNVYTNGENYIVAKTAPTGYSIVE